MLFAPSNIWSAYDNDAIGTAISDPVLFETFLASAISKHDESNDRAPGQHFIIMPSETVSACGVSCGVGYATDNTEDYVLRNYRGVVKPFLKRSRALVPSFFAIIVYTREAYMADPDVIQSGDTPPEGATHILVAAIANAESAPNPPPRFPDNLVACLAGGNNEAETWTLDEVKEMASQSNDYSRRFSVVAT